MQPDTRPIDNVNLTLKSLFVLEGSTQTEGGPVVPGGFYRFRHLATSTLQHSLNLFFFHAN